MEDLTGKQLGPYQIVSRLGIGGMATVFKAYQPTMDRYVALKVLPRHFSKDSDFIHRFSQEARLIAKLEHPHILPVHDYGESDGYTYLVMRLVEGGSLSDLLQKQGKLELTKINSIISQMGGALDYAHQKGVIHRDFKPSNVLIDKFDNCLLTDFGIAKMVEATSHLTHTGGILGTPTYISPEQGAGQPIDIRSDIYSLGIVLYQMVVGDVPFKADTPMAVIFKHIQDPLPLPRQKVPDLSKSVERVILKALAKNPDDRYSTAIELVNALQPAIDHPTARIPKGKEPVIEPDATRLVRKTPTDKKEIPTKPHVKPRPETVKTKEIKEKETLPEHTEKIRAGRRWGYGALSIFLLAMFAGAGWYYFSNIFISEPIYGRLDISSNPCEADVFIDGKKEGKTPLILKEVQKGRRIIKLKKVDFDVWKREVYIKANEVSKIQADLVAAKALEKAKQEDLEKQRSFEKERIKEVKTHKMVTPLQEKEISKSLGMEFVYIEPGTFLMGSPSNETGRDNHEKQYRLTLTKGFYMQATEVTQGQWKAVMGNNPSHFKNCGDDCPVENVSWNDVQQFIRKLNQQEGSGIYRLPTEEEWEYAARAGTETPFSFGKCLSTDEANYDGNYPYSGCSKGKYRKSTIPVSSLSPNAWGLYDMHGNVWEWCQDWYGDYPSSGSGRVFRGGSWSVSAEGCRSANRIRGDPSFRRSNLGFRLLRNP